MTEVEFLGFIRKAAHRATQKIGRIGNLICTQTEGTREPTLREPEMRSALQQQAEEDGLLYGIEVPTLYPYRFSGKGENGRRALTDFALLASGEPNAFRNVLVELKEGQSSRAVKDGDDDDYPAIRKDLHKLLAEPSAHGACMLHICQAANSGTIASLQRKYTAAMRAATSNAPETIHRHPTVSRNHLKDGESWFLVLILVVHPRGKDAIGKGSYLLRGVWQADVREWRFEQDQYFP